MIPNHSAQREIPAAPPSSRLPLAPTRITYVLLGLVAVAFLAQLLAGGSTSTRALIAVGAQVNSLVATGEVWRLLTAMFLHIGLTHIAFNAWALFSLGQDVEALYGSLWFVVIYFIAGLGGNLAYYLFGPDVLSAGASGAVFGLIGSQVGFFLLNRELFGQFGRQRLSNLAVLIGINLVFGFTVPGINNLAHLGGLVTGFALSLALAPRYRVRLVSFEGTAEHPGPVIARAIFDLRSRLVRIVAVALAVLLLFGALQLGNQRWTGSADVLRLQAESAFDAGDFGEAQRLLEQALAIEPDDGLTLYNLGLVYAQQDQLRQSIAAFEDALRVLPDSVDVWFWLGLTYAMDGRVADARPLLEKVLVQETTGTRADYVRSVLATLR